MEAESGPPPSDALRCPLGLGHHAIAVREQWFYCRACARVEPIQGDGRYEAVRDTRTGGWLEHEEFVGRWGAGVYGRDR